MTQTISLESDLSQVGPACQQVCASLRKAGLQDAQISNAELCLTEALNNAIEHGLSLAPGHSLEVETKTEGDKVTLITRYQGGSNITQADIDAATGPIPEPDPDDPETWLARGRGLKIMNSLCDSVRVSSDGDRHQMELVLR